MPTAAGGQATVGSGIVTAMRTDRSPRRVVLIVGASLLGLAAIAVLLLWVTAPRESAADAAQEYLDAIAAGDVELANQLVPTLPSDADEGTIDGRTAEAVTGAVPITDASILGAEQTEETAQVQVSYAVGEETYTSELTVERAESSRPFAEDWQVTTSLALVARVLALDAGLHYSVGGLALDDQAGGRITLYPGSYPVAVQGGTYLADQQYTLDLAPRTGDRPSVQVVPEPTPALADELTGYVRDAVDRCAVRDESYVTQCQLWANRDGDGIALEPVTWTVVEPPAIEETHAGVVEVITVLRAEYEVAEGSPDGPRHDVTEDVRLRTELLLDFESPDAYEIDEVDWRTLPSGS